MEHVRPKWKFPNKLFGTFLYEWKTSRSELDFSATGYNHHSEDIFGVQGFLAALQESVKDFFHMKN